jgi:hypothetical protein
MPERPTFHSLPLETFEPISFEDFKRRAGRIDVQRHAALVRRAYLDADRGSETSIAAAVQYVYREARSEGAGTVEVRTVLEQKEGEDALSG